MKSLLGFIIGFCIGAVVVDKIDSLVENSLALKKAEEELEEKRKALANA